MVKKVDFSKTKPYEFDEYEQTARRMIEACREQLEWSSERQIALGVWRAMYMSALTLEQVHAIGCALFGYKEWPAEAACEELRKAGFLRRRIQGVTRARRVYEIRFR